MKDFIGPNRYREYSANFVYPLLYCDKKHYSWTFYDRIIENIYLIKNNIHINFNCFLDPKQYSVYYRDFNSIKIDEDDYYYGDCGHFDCSFGPIKKHKKCLHYAPIYNDFLSENFTKLFGSEIENLSEDILFDNSFKAVSAYEKFKFI